jgi:hypothetical protein
MIKLLSKEGWEMEMRDEEIRRWEIRDSVITNL